MINYIKQFEDGSTQATVNKPSWGMYEKTSADDNRDVYIDGKWYPTSGGELITNGTFDTDVSGWTVNSGTAIWESGQMKTSSSSNVVQSVPTIIGETYTAKGTATYISGGNCGFNINGDIYYINASSYDLDIEFIATASTTEVLCWAGTSGVAYFDNISVYKTKPTLGEPYNHQFTYASKDGKLLGVEVANGQPVDLHYDEYAPTLVEDTIQADTMLSDNFVGKNACTAWVNFDGTTTPPTIRDSFNVSDVVRTSTGKYVVNFTTDMDTTSYGANISHDDGFTQDTNGGEQYSDKTISSVKCSTYITSSSVGRDAENITLHIIGGKN